MPLTTDYLRIPIMKTRMILLYGLLMISTPGLTETTLSVNSGDKKTALLELYTSEGCNSCPPADKWLGSLADKGFTSTEVVPVAFHVDYWNYLGWRDRYSNPDYSRRQQLHVAQNKMSTAYTPQLILNGKNLRPSRLLTTRLDSINHEVSDVKIKLQASYQPGGNIHVDVTINSVTNHLEKNLELYLALLSNKIVSSVAAGENAGRTLKHYHVVRKLLGPFSLRKDKPTRISRLLELPENTTAKEASLVAFVQSPEQEIHQAVKLQLR